ncbi:hypothetical protein [Amycolatopsis sp. cmx-11-12]|uniref:LppU/SCO3897 family protein n=1 Tax=Amycolatopsis sp. cmx-11-12 TaxID=2785795 RepID=UPI003916D84B
MPRKKTWLKPVVVLGIFGAMILEMNTEVGACLKGEIDKPSNVENSECGTPDANFKVVGKWESTSEVAFRFSGGVECDEYPAVDAYLFQGKSEAADREGRLRRGRLQGPRGREETFGLFQ